MGEQTVNFRIVQIPQPFFEPTNVIRIGDVILDTCHADDSCTSVFLQQMDGGDLDGVNEVIVTHPHVDHLTGSASVPKLSEMPHTILRGAERITRDLKAYLYGAQAANERLFVRGDDMLRQIMRGFAQMYWPAHREYQPVNISKVVEAGDMIHIGDITLKVIHTPGHEENHMALFHEPSGLLFSGDLIRNSAHFNWVPLTCRVAEYEKSLRAVLELNPKVKVIVPSHGSPIYNPVEHINKCIANVRDIKDRVLKTLEKDGGSSHLEIAKTTFNASDPMKWGTVAAALWSYLECLEEEGKITLDRNEQTAKLR